MMSLVEKSLAQIKYIRKRRVLAPLEKKLEKDFQKAFRQQRKAVLARFTALKSEFQEKSLTQKIDALMEPVLEDAAPLMVGSIEGAATVAMSAAYKQRSTEFGLSFAFDVKNKRAISYLQKYAARRVTGINKTTQNEIARIIVKGQESGWSYDHTARAISRKFNEFAVGQPQAHIQSRAHLVAVTEAGEAYETGNRQVIDEMVDTGLEMEMSWSTVGAANVCDICLANAAAGWISTTGAFPSGHQHAPAHPACRCANLYRRKT